MFGASNCSVCVNQCNFANSPCLRLSQFHMSCDWRCNFVYKNTHYLTSLFWCTGTEEDDHQNFYWQPEWGHRGWWCASSVWEVWDCGGVWCPEELWLCGECMSLDFVKLHSFLGKGTLKLWQIIMWKKCMYTQFSYRQPKF